MKLMELIRRVHSRVCLFCNDVVRWRSIFAVPYIMGINFMFCFLAFRAKPETQEHALCGLISLVALTDLFLPTHDHSILFAIVSWPVRDLFKTFCVASSLFAIYQLRQGELYEAFISSGLATISLIVKPVYHYYDVNAQISTFFGRMGDAIKWFLAYFVVRPLLVFYDWTKYIFLFQWVLVVLNYLRGRFSAVIAWWNKRVIEPLCAKCRRLAELARYWLCFHWCVDLARWAKRAFLLPLAERLSSTLDAFIYVVGCYWLRPVLNAISRQMLEMCAALGRLAWQAGALFMVHIAIPLSAAMLTRLWEALVIGYRIVAQPLVDRCRARYHRIENMAYIYVLGPVFKCIVDSLPEKNPFVETSDAELADYLPRSAIEDEESGCETDTSSRLSLQHSLSDEDEGEFLPRGLRRVGISDSESSDDEFSLRPRLRHSQRKAKNRLSMLSAFSMGSASTTAE